MKFRIKDREYEWDGNMTLEEAMLLFDKAGIGIAEIAREQMRGNPYVQATMIYFMKKRAGEAVRWQDMASFSLTDVEVVPEDDDEATEDGAPAGEPPDPTKADGETPESDITNT